MKVTSDSPSSTVVDYSCGGAGFGHTKIDLITPRSLRIETQGVSDNLPFSYVLQARRVGDCARSRPPRAIKAAFNHCRVRRPGAGFGTLSSQSGMYA